MYSWMYVFRTIKSIDIHVKTLCVLFPYFCFTLNKWALKRAKKSESPLWSWLHQSKKLLRNWRYVTLQEDMTKSKELIIEGFMEIDMHARSMMPLCRYVRCKYGSYHTSHGKEIMLSYIILYLISQIVLNDIIVIEKFPLSYCCSTTSTLMMMMFS
jgi:hypothetical protein